MFYLRQQRTTTYHNSTAAPIDYQTRHYAKERLGVKLRSMITKEQ